MELLVIVEPKTKQVSSSFTIEDFPWFSAAVLNPDGGSRRWRCSFCPVLIRSNNFSADSSLGVWGTRAPRKARVRRNGVSLSTCPWAWLNRGVVSTGRDCGGRWAAVFGLQESGCKIHGCAGKKFSRRAGRAEQHEACTMACHGSAPDTTRYGRRSAA